MTLKDIAKRAGVSTMTVSNVINGKNSRVSTSTIKKVNAIIAECGYVPNLSARSLTKKTSNIIGILVSIYEDDSDFTESNYMENPYISSMIGTIEKELHLNGYFSILRFISKKDDLTFLSQSWNVDGMIFLHPDHRQDIKAFITTAPFPVVMFDNDFDMPELIRICSDDVQGLYQSTKYMINHGHSRIAFVGRYQDNPLVTRRFHGYCKALENSGIPFRKELVYSISPTYEGGIEAGKQIAADNTGITAVVTTADICAIGIMEGARLGGLRIPIDLSIIGYDNLTLCKYLTPKLTSVSQNMEKKAQLGTRLLLEKIRTGTIQGPRHITLNTHLIERQSVISLF